MWLCSVYCLSYIEYLPATHTVSVEQLNIQKGIDAVIIVHQCGRVFIPLLIKVINQREKVLVRSQMCVKKNHKWRLVAAAVCRHSADTRYAARSMKYRKILKRERNSHL